MSSDDDPDLVPNFSEDRPLDSLMPEMQDRGDEQLHEDAPREVGAIHPRVLEVELEEGKEWSLACWSDPGPARMREQFGNLVEATLIKEMSRLPEWERDEDREFTGMRLLTFDSLAADSRGVVEGLGFAEADYDPDQYSERMSAWRQEASAADLEMPARPISVWHLPVAHPDARSSELARIASRMLGEIGSEVWGETPGGLSRHAARELEETLGVDVGLDLSGLEAFEQHFVVDETETIRWIEPIFYQAICDFIGVLLHGKYGLQVQWGVCEPDPRGIVPPPTFRQPGAGRGETIPVGRYVLEWCLMPVRDGEKPPTLAARVDALANRLGDRG